MERFYRQDRYLQHGHGLGSFLAGIVKTIVPWLSKAAPKAIKVATRVAKSKSGQQLRGVLEKQAKKIALKTASSALQGDNGMKGAKKALKAASTDLSKTLDQIAERQNGGTKKQGGAKRKKKNGAAAAAAPSFSPAKRQKLQKSKLGGGSRSLI